jgi:hypothetical protein
VNNSGLTIDDDALVNTNKVATKVWVNPTRTLTSGGGGGSGLTPEQVAMIEAMNEKIDVKVSSRSSRGQVANISTSGGYSKDDRKRDETTAQYAENTLKLLKKMKTDIADSITGVLDAI